MRKIEYLSPSSLKIYNESPDEYYTRYLSDYKPPKEPQNKHMAIGSAFDAYVKSYVYCKLFGDNHNPRFKLETIFESQVEEHNRTLAWVDGKKLFDLYVSTGALADLMIELNQAVNVPRFEIEIRGVVEGKRDGLSRIVNGITFLGKPDVFYINKAGYHVLFDWKVTGYYSKYNITPMPGYLRVRGSNNLNRPHKDAVLMLHQGQVINVAHYLETLNPDWASQLSIYGWLVGQNVGDDFIIAIDQVCGQDRVAEHRLRIGTKYQWSLFNRALEIWEIVNSNHYFRDLSLEDSLARCQALDLRAKEYDKFFNSVVMS